MSFVLEILKLKKRKLWCIRIISFFGRCYSFDNTGYYNCYFYSIVINVYNLQKRNKINIFGKFDDKKNFCYDGK